VKIGPPNSEKPDNKPGGDSLFDHEKLSLGLSDFAETGILVRYGSLEAAILWKSTFGQI